MAETKKNYELNSRKRGFVESYKNTYKWVSHKSIENIYEENGKKRILRCKQKKLHWLKYRFVMHS